MVIRQAQIRSLGRAVFLANVYSFLLERTRHPALRQALVKRDSVLALWNRVMDSFDTGSEYRTAILLTYAIGQQCMGPEPLAALGRLLASREPEFAAKCFFEDTGILRFSEFDIPSEVAEEAASNGAV